METEDVLRKQCAALSDMVEGVPSFRVGVEEYKGRRCNVWRAKAGGVDKEGAIALTGNRETDEANLCKLLEGAATRLRLNAPAATPAAVAVAPVSFAAAHAATASVSSVSVGVVTGVMPEPGK